MPASPPQETDVNAIPSDRPNHGLRSAGELAEAGLIDPDRLTAIERVAERYAIAITPAMVELIDAGDAADPIARQFVPDESELEAGPEERADPIGDLPHSPLPGLVHRYPDRVLLTPLLACPVYCRFCFRRERVGREHALGRAALDAALAYIAAHKEIWEVIVTGGDPLMLPPPRIVKLLAALGAIPHLRIVRFHTRVPVVDPGRVNAAMVAGFDCAKTVWIAVHVDHARELTEAARAACARLARAGIPLVGQTVLLRGVNDDPFVLEALLRAMVESRIKPYYLHQLDAAPGTARFRVPIAEGQALMRALRGRVSGLCRPEYVLDIPGGHGKSPIGPTYLRDGEIEDWRGDRHPCA